MFPDYWQAFTRSHDLIGVSASLGEDADLSGLGVELQFLTEAQATEELTECWPGIAVAGDGYVPVAWCSQGSGDYYYINRNDGAGGALYRVYHDAVNNEGRMSADGIVRVLANYEALLGFVER